ncbi:23S rRNA accumulation protein YceD [Pseudidiomarina terrestris]|uniref:Large ribosomal RNA subunit accumulation protein YceD n=1 Tax=Pseudidiomarina terrestris TaxID=2820060 RepID=A0AAW7QY05_9GAMM|nr:MULTISPECIES: 23S rRNA accumulation protein YceD [unclassified Pseudidiomarina]MDN7123632.1 23S rRNA accumulation protein YceD [Pseudidiomarina sp. 1APP75-32.1]MDN7126578.1 23S rRNA accumulation protein YceD [Pseudidiomarina sp. 1APR75-33.1]MDN7128644.1 23S rRNA accumulation protein YceD [Pseudidiomarina sp. 1APR75-15]MDN7135097.1 23S rRNA accumulation protein YceD [Pseudidiomarina sp. 1ASP75-5]MDN7137768.1 23S rRNA accumulation protein YceD [Pseudidiomarina sp. 1ASP75-14]
MQKVRIPISVDPVKSAGKQLSYHGVVPGTSLTRLQELLVVPCADVDADLDFAVDAQNIKHVRGHAEVKVTVACERCGDPMAVELVSDFVYAPVTKRQTAADMPDEYEAIEVDELGEIQLHRIIEDELILAMPVVVKHDERECRVDSNAMQWGKIEDATSDEDNPFAVLQALKRK